MKTKNILLIFMGIFFLLLTNCKKDEKVKPVLETGTVTDVEGHTYKTVKIGNQWWMSEDLRTTKYRDSSFISQVTAADTTWAMRTAGAYCNNLDPLGHTIGVLYNYYTINDPKGIAPIGWHIPTDDEWQVMEKYLGMSSEDVANTGWRGSHEGEKMKVVSGTVLGWSNYGNIWSTNESGFTALGMGCRMFDGSWGSPGQYSTAFWWTASAQTGNKAWYRYLDYKNANVFRYYGPLTYGFGVRCVKD